MISNRITACVLFSQLAIPNIYKYMYYMRTARERDMHEELWRNSSAA